MKQVIMRYVLETKKPLQKKLIDSFDAGGYDFIINGESIMFDFDAFNINTTQLEDGRLKIEYESGRGLVFNDYDICADFDEDYIELGLTREDITAVFLSSATSILEFHFAFYSNQLNDYVDADYEIIEISFEDENEKIYKMNL